MCELTCWRRSLSYRALVEVWMIPWSVRRHSGQEVRTSVSLLCKNIGNLDWTWTSGCPRSWRWRCRRGHAVTYLRWHEGNSCHVFEIRVDVWTCHICVTHFICITTKLHLHHGISVNIKWENVCHVLSLLTGVFCLPELWHSSGNSDRSCSHWLWSSEHSWQDIFSVSVNNCGGSEQENWVCHNTCPYFPPPHIPPGIVCKLLIGESRWVLGPLLEQGLGEKLGQTASSTENEEGWWEWRG